MTHTISTENVVGRLDFHASARSWGPSGAVFEVGVSGPKDDIIGEDDIPDGERDLETE